MKALTKRQKTTITSYLKRSIEVISKRKIDLECLRENGDNATVASIALEEIEKIENDFNELFDGFINDQSKDYQQHESIDIDFNLKQKIELSEGEMALLSLYKEKFPHAFNQNDVNDRLDYMREYGFNF